MTRFVLFSCHVLVFLCLENVTGIRVFPTVLITWKPRRGKSVRRCVALLGILLVIEVLAYCSYVVRFGGGGGGYFVLFCLVSQVLLLFGVFPHL